MTMLSLYQVTLYLATGLFSLKLRASPLALAVFVTKQFVIAV